MRPHDGSAEQNTAVVGNKGLIPPDAALDARLPYILVELRRATIGVGKSTY